MNKCDVHIIAKKLVQNPATVWSDLLNSLSCEQQRHAWTACSKAVQSHAVLINELQLARRKQSRAIGETRKSNGDVQPLIEAMAVMSKRLSTLQAELHQLLSALPPVQAKHNSELGVESVEVVSSDLPPWFRRPRASAGTTGSCSHEVVISEAEHGEEWQHYARTHSGYTLHHDFRWKQIIESTFGHPTPYLLAKDDRNRVCGVMPLVHISSRLFGSFLCSMPYLNYGGPLSDSESVDAQLMAEVAKRAQQHHCRHAEIRETLPRAGWPGRSHKVAMVLELPESSQQFEENLPAKVRSQARKAGRHGAETHWGGVELLDEFYRVFSTNMRDLGTPVYAKSFFRNILLTFSEEVSLVVVRIERRPIAAALLMSHGSVMEVPWASSLREFRDSAVNMHLYRDVLKGAIERGHRWFDFGRSSPQASTYRFKQQWGAQAYPLHWHYWLANGGEPPALDPSNARYRTVIRTWQRLPVWLTNRLGPPIVKNLP